MNKEEQITQVEGVKEQLIIEKVEDVSSITPIAGEEGQKVQEEQEKVEGESPVQTIEEQVKLYTEQEINEIIQGRIIRAERNFQKHLAEHAGVALDQNEPAEAVKLWGFMKLNPQVSQAIQQVIDSYVNEGKAVMPQKTNTVSNELALREAVIDLKEQDAFFAKNFKQIMSWAENNNFEITNEKTLKLAVLAWKGENAPIQAAQAQLNAQKKAQQKQEIKKTASLEGGTAPRSTGVKLDYSKATDRDILKHEGLSLFVE